MISSVHEFYSGDEGYLEWKLTGIDKGGQAVQTHGVDHLRFVDGQIALKNSFRKI